MYTFSRDRVYRQQVLYTVVVTSVWWVTSSRKLCGVEKGDVWAYTKHLNLSGILAKLLQLTVRIPYTGRVWH
jgi:hypothetical protein